ncbi:MAG: hypothetical protein CL920_07960 [Deltaproteobacteria bacterium]|nr:hypothetical protein [Deltaproteobacteria bacterium]MBU48614.1 hypothetical protein [Deltaproteobacteria bacterium]
MKNWISTGGGAVLERTACLLYVGVGRVGDNGGADEAVTLKPLRTPCFSYTPCTDVDEDTSL